MTEFAKLLPLIQIRPEAHALDVAALFGAERGAAHLRMQVQAGWVRLPFQSTALMAETMQTAQTGGSRDDLANAILASVPTNLALKMDLEASGSADAHASIRDWVSALDPSGAPHPSRALPPIPSTKTFAAVSTVEAPIGPALSLPGFKGWVRQPLTLAFAAGFAVVALYRALGLHGEADLSLKPATQDTAMFPGATANENYQPDVQPAPPLPPPASPPDGGGAPVTQPAPPAASVTPTK